MAITNFIPEIWNARMLLDFREQAIAATLANREYEGDARVGNKVKITSAVDIAIKNYKTGNNNVPRTTAPDAVTDEGQELAIDQEKSFDFYIDDIDRRQAAGSLGAYTQSAGLGMAEDADKFLLSTAVTQAKADDLPTSLVLPASPTGDDAFNLLNIMRKVLNKRHVPKGSRVAIVNAEFEALLLGADSKLTAFDTSGDTQGLREAAVGRLLGFNIYSSENLPETDVPQVLGFFQPSLAYVSQIVETEAMRGQDKFSDRLRGLHVYGGKVVRPEGVVAYTAPTV